MVNKAHGWEVVMLFNSFFKQIIILKLELMSEKI